MTKQLAFFLGAAFILAFHPGWSQPATEPKSLLLLLAGALSWGWIAWKRRPMARYPWALALPLGWLLLSALWSPAPFLGLQRVLWLLAACGLGSLLATEEDLDGFFRGFLAASALHALLIGLQWIPPVRAALPSGFGMDLQQGIGRGFFHNTNQAAQPLLLAMGWVLLRPREHARSMDWHLLWLLPALALTQSRWGAAVAAAFLAARAASTLRRPGPTGISRWIAFLEVGLALGFAMAAHRLGWVPVLAGAAFGLLWNTPFPSQTGPPRPWAAAALALSLWAAIPAMAPKNAPAPTSPPARAELVPAPRPVDMSLSERRSYYQASLLAILDRPLAGHGLGAARAVFPAYVDKNLPSSQSAYGDFRRPNNLHSEPLELLVEGGLLLLLAFGIGLWLDRCSPSQPGSWKLALPLLALALLDFPLHAPLGLAWLGLALRAHGDPDAPGTPRARQLVHASLGVVLAAAACGQAYTAHLRPSAERRFLNRTDPVATQAQARRLWKAYPFSADLFDLYSKASIQAASVDPDPARVRELYALLARDPFDHHLLLACGQGARRQGDTAKSSQLFARYDETAPRDPDRYLRLAQAAADQGKGAAVIQLLAAARKRPDFSQRHQAEFLKLLPTAPQASPVRP